MLLWTSSKCGSRRQRGGKEAESGRRAEPTSNPVVKSRENKSPPFSRQSGRRKEQVVHAGRGTRGKKSRAEESDKELGEECVVKVWASLRFVSRSPALAAEGRRGREQWGRGGFPGGAENGRGRVARGCKISREHEQSAIPLNDSPPG